MIKELQTGDLKCVCATQNNKNKVVYMIYPEIVPFKNEWLEDMASKYNTNLAVIYIPSDEWNDMLTPWPEPGETPDSPPFAGDAAKTLLQLQKVVIPSVEKTLDLPNNVTRNLIGVSLSGLFTLWQWLQSSIFSSVASLSGSFWYPGFIDWFEGQSIPQKSGMAYFLLGVKEPKAWIKEYRSVGINTEKIVSGLKSAGIATEFSWVPGDHFTDPLERAELALSKL